jgi:hypothetical protein
MMTINHLFAEDAMTLCLRTRLSPCMFVLLVSATLVAQSNPVLPDWQRLQSPSTWWTSMSRPDSRTQSEVMQKYAKVPLSFEVNRGQTDASVRFLSRGSGYTLFLSGDEAVFELQGSDGTGSLGSACRHAVAPTSKRGRTPNQSTTSVLRVRLQNSNRAANVASEEELPGRSNYFTGTDPAKWLSNVPTFAKVKYESIYPGIDLVYYGNQQQLEYDFIVAPGADPRAIHLDIRGARRIRRDHNGDLVVHTGGGNVRCHKPVVYQVKNHQRQEIEGHYVITGRNQVGFKVSNYDHKKPLVIDPIVGYSTYLGGSNYESGTAIAVDGAGNVYVTGTTQSVDFPTSPGASQTTCGACASGERNLFVTKLNSTGSALVYSTYLGGSSGEVGSGLALDATGNVYVTGVTQSPDFPITQGAFQATCSGGCVFVTKLDRTGSTLAYSTYLGRGSASSGIAIDATGNAYMTGIAVSTDFPITQDAFQTSCSNSCTFVTKLDSTGSGLVYSTFFGGAQAAAIAVDTVGNAYLTGLAGPDLPTTPGAFQPQCAYCGLTDGAGDGFVSKLNADGSALVYSTYLGGGDLDGGSGIVVDGAGNAFVTGETLSLNFPTTPGAFQTTCGGCATRISDAFVTKLNSSGSALIYSTYLGGSNQDWGTGIAIDAAGNAYVTGVTESSDFPTTPSAMKTSCTGCAFVAKVNPDGTTLLYSTELGGSKGEGGASIATDASGNAYVTGCTASPDFPTTPGAFQTRCGGTCGPGMTDAFVAKLATVDFTVSSSALSSVRFCGRLVNCHDHRHFGGWLQWYSRLDLLRTTESTPGPWLRTES